MKYIELSNGEKLAYFEEGEHNVQKILMIHVHSLSSGMFKDFFSKLRENFHIVAPDLRGTANSSYYKPLTSLSDWADDLSEFCEKLNLKKVIYLSIGAGSYVGLFLSIHKPELISKLLLFAPYPLEGFPVYKLDEKAQPTGERVQSKEEMLKHPYVQMFAQALENGNKDFLEQILRTMICTGKSFIRTKEQLQYIYEVAGTIKGWNDSSFLMSQLDMTTEEGKIKYGDVSKIKCKIRIITGENDVLCNPENCKRLAEQLKADVKVFSQTGHLFYVDNPNEFIEEIKSFAEDEFLTELENA